MGEGRNLGRKITVAKLTAYDSDTKEKPHYKFQAPVTDRAKGLLMINYLKRIFGVDNSEMDSEEKKEVEEQKKLIGQNKIKWTRDEKGNIVSPFRNNRKLNFGSGKK